MLISAPYKERVEMIAKEIKGRVLDIGCCWGTMHRQLKQIRNDCEIFGIDISITEMYKNDKNIFMGDAQKMDMFYSETFDTIIAGEVIEHLEEPEKMIKEACRLLKPRGKLIITTNNKGSLINRIFHTYESKATTHRHIFQKAELTSLLEENGFKIRSLSMLPYVSSRYSFTDPFRIFAGRIFPSSLRENFFIVAEKE